ncbi:helix-turn-helix domain-containing protein [Mogibacterium kristiansenii]|uniref:Helix-turn-helix domain-containing protein n=1 Tax=Mogibacterium kristiansenii TaxID=2606708 RepID=A0A6N7XMK4_9FIRM|nr:helix-turn-helix domain-containing protein [Mogibacterium kristiansenii]
MTQAQLAQKLGVSDKSVSKWERRLRLLPRNT